MLAGLKSRNRDLAVSDVGSKYVNRINCGVCQELMIVGINLSVRRTVLFSCLLSPFGDQVAECAHINILGLLRHSGKMLLVGDTAAANKTDL